MNRKKALFNIVTSVSFKVIILVVSLISRRYLTNILGEEATGLFSLYTSVLGFLAIAELGIGTAILFSIYKPIVEGDDNTVSALFYLYKKIYRYIFLVIAFVGLILTPFIPYFASENTGTYNISFTYIIFLSSVLITYLYAYKSSFINAHLDNYITVTIRSLGLLIEAVLQIIVIVKFKSFNLFFISILISNLLQWLMTSIVFKYKYNHKLNNNKDLDLDVKNEVVKQTKAMFFHKIGGLLVNTTDSIIISAFISVSILGVYSNYIVIVTGLIGLISLLFTSISTIIGQAYAKLSKEAFHNQFKTVFLVNYLVGIVFFLGFYAIINNLIAIVFNDNVILANQIVIVITVNYFIQFMKQAIIVYRDATGTFYYDRYKPLFEGVTNLILSIILVKFLGLSGVLIGTIITNLTICAIIEPYVLYKHGFQTSPKKLYIYYYLGVIIFFGLLMVFQFIPQFASLGLFISLIVRGGIAVLIGLTFILVIYLVNKEIRSMINSLIEEVKLMIKNILKRS